MATAYSTVFTRFLGKIDDDLYNYLTTTETEADLITIMEASFLLIRYPRADLSDRSNTTKQFNFDLEERLQELISVAMKYEWCGRQIYQINVTRQKFTEGDFKLTSQANHLDKLIIMQQQAERELHHKSDNRSYTTGSGNSNWSSLAGGS